MSAVAADPLGLSTLLGFFEPRSRARHAASADTRASQPHHLDAFADKVLGAASVEDLSDQLELVAADPSFWALPLPDQASLKQAERRRHWLLNRISDPLRRTIGEEPMKIFCVGWEAMTSFARAMVPILRESTQKSGVAVAATQTPAHMLYDTDTPLEMRRAILALSKAIVAAIGVFRAVRLGKKLPPWLALALANHFTGGVHEFLAKLIASAQGQTKPVPDRADPDAWYRDAIASGKDAYFPLGGPDVGAG